MSNGELIWVGVITNCRSSLGPTTTALTGGARVNSKTITFVFARSWQCCPAELWSSGMSSICTLLWLVMTAPVVPFLTRRSTFAKAGADWTEVNATTTAVKPAAGTGGLATVLKPPGNRPDWEPLLWKISGTLSVRGRPARVGAMTFGVSSLLERAAKRRSCWTAAGVVTIRPARGKSTDTTEATASSAQRRLPRAGKFWVFMITCDLKWTSGFGLQESESVSW